MKPHLVPWLLSSCLLACGGSSKSTGDTSSGGNGGTSASGGTASGAGGSGGAPSATGGSGTGGGAASGGATAGTAAGGSTAATGGTGASAGNAGSSLGGAGMSGAGISGKGGGGVSGNGGAGAAGRGNAGASGNAGSSAAGSGGALGGRSSGGASGTGHGGGSAGSAHTSCQTDTDCNGLKCCGNSCVNVVNDILNCGSCGNACAGPHPYCSNATCGTPPCTGPSCNGSGTCCGTQCCADGKLCCTVNMGQEVTACYDPVDGTCPVGCVSCVCADPATPIATPEGERPIAELAPGDLVYSVDRGRIVAVPLVRVHRQRVTPEHGMIEVELESGRKLRLSYGHPTSDGRPFGGLAAGDLLDGVRVVGRRATSYDQPYTYDILPASESGAYFAAGVLIGSTLAARTEPRASLSPSAPMSARAR